MPATTTKIGIINRALQLLGQPKISSLTENSRSAEEMSTAYDPIFLSEIEAHTWKFTIRRASLAKDATAPVFGKHNYYPVPPDFLRRAPDETTFFNPQRHDYDFEIFNNTECIVSDEAAPLDLRYISNSITESLFSATFAEAFAHALALATCEAITNSNSKQQNLTRGYVAQINRAKRINDIQKSPTKSPTCSFIAVRD